MISKFGISTIIHRPVSEDGCSIKGFNLNPLLIFTIAEVFLFDSKLTGAQIIEVMIAYCWILGWFLKSSKIGIMYLVAFDILSIGALNYLGNKDSIISFWGLRVGGFSFNILFTFLLTIIYAIKLRLKGLFPSDPFTKFFLIFYIWTLITGLICVLSGVNYSDNFTNDLLMFTPIILFVILLSRFSYIEYKTLTVYCFVCSMLGLFLAYLLDQKSGYGGEKFFISSSISFISPIAIFLLAKYYNKFVSSVIIIMFIWLVATSSYLMGGKPIIMLILLIAWIIGRSKKFGILGLLMVTCSLPLIATLLDTLIAYTTSGIIAFKLRQVAQMFSSPDFIELASQFSSIGNLVAELITLITYLIDHPLYILTGKGMGAGISDIYGWLAPFAGASGYSDVDAVRNNFYNLHLAPYKVMINGGLIFLGYFIYLLIKLLKQRTDVSFIAFVLFFMIFYVNKEMALLTYCFIRMSVLQKDLKLYKCFVHKV